MSHLDRKAPAIRPQTQLLLDRLLCLYLEGASRQRMLFALEKGIAEIQGIEKEKDKAA